MTWHTPVKPNTNGRWKYSALCGLVFSLGCVLGAAGAMKPAVAIHPGSAAIIALVNFAYLVLLGFVSSAYAMRYVNVGFLTLSSVLLLVVVRTSYKANVGMVILCTESVLFITLAFMALLLLQRPTSDLALRLHPFFSQPEFEEYSAADQRVGGRSSATSADASQTSSKRGKRRVKHRQVSIFEHWPAPIPFTGQALYTYHTSVDSELPFSRGDQLIILDCRGNWWQARHPHTHVVGFVPSNYIQVLQKARVKKTWDAKDEDEASIREGETVEVMEVHEFMCLIRNVEGRIGSVPTDNLEVSRKTPEDL